MKARISVWMIAGLLAITLNQSCKKQDSVAATDTETQTSEDNAYAENTYNDVYGLVDDASRKHPGVYKTADAQMAYLSGCEKITVDSTVMPHTMTIDFGTGCVGNDGRTRTGKVLVSYTGRYRDSGTVITITFDDYTVTDLVNSYAHKVTGTKTITNMGRNAAGHPIFSIEVKEGKITNTNGEITWNSSRTREWSEGYNTPYNIFDDTYLVSGTASGTNRNGVSYSAAVSSSTPLKFRVGCRWIESGIMTLTPQGKATRTIDFGNGDCDDVATVTVNSKQYTVHMH